MNAMKEYVVRISLGGSRKTKSFHVGEGFPSADAEWVEVVRMARRHVQEILESNGFDGRTHEVGIEQINQERSALEEML